MSELLLLTLIFFPSLVGLSLLAAPKKVHPYLGLISATSALFCCAIVGYLTLVPLNEPSISYEWFEQGFMRFSFLADGLALFFTLLITGMGVLVFFYANYLMDATDENIKKFYCYMNLFMSAMLGAVLANNLLLLFVFWELTGLMSYMLISYHYDNKSARTSSRLALLLNSLASLCLLLGIIIIAVLDQTLEITEVVSEEIIANVHSDWYIGVMILMLIGVFAKSAQFPFHFWLPQAMSAPTPVSAYLHSATMVKLGIYFLARTYPLFVDSPLWLPILTSVSITTILIGGFWALFATPLKRILAYATISQLGFFISFYGIGSPEGLHYDYIHMFNHALYKGSLFMLVGIMAHCASITNIHQLSKLYRKLPFTSIIFAVSLAAMAGVPGTTGFLSKELLIADIVSYYEQQSINFAVVLCLLLGLVFKVTFSFRLFYALFIDDSGEHAVVKSKPKKHLLIPPFILSFLALVFGIWPQALQALYSTYSIEGLHKPNAAAIDLWHGFSLNLIISLGFFSAGILLFFLIRNQYGLYDRLEKFGFVSYWDAFIDSLPKKSEQITSWVHSNSPQKNLYWIFILFIGFLGGGLLYIQPELFFKLQLTQVRVAEIFLLLSTCLIMIMNKPASRMISLSLVGTYITYYFVLKQAPDVAITQMVVEVATLFVFVLLLFSLKDRSKFKLDKGRGMLALVAGLTAASLPLLNNEIGHGDALGIYYLKNSITLALGNNAVNTILVDFRGLDTLGEIAVIAVAAISITALLGKKPNSRIINHDPWIATPIIKAIMPAIMFVASLFSIYLLVRGHNHPGGGFSAGMNLSISIVLGSMCLGNHPIIVWTKVHSLKLMMIGLFISLVSAVIPMIFSENFMTALFYNNIEIISTPFLFDFGIFILVQGAVMSILSVMRENTIAREVA
ncbi:MAG: hydrogen gas-evolving membrane-bound hydrogenase subunit E [Chlamydiota bacterium]|nr:hydrogen gas-evolving membrane-bound hydrogenase subunit E [Chlamydiota bacterium]